MLTLSKNQAWLFCLFPALFLSDILYGAFDYYQVNFPISPGTMLRGTVLFISALMMLRYFQMVNKSIIFWVVLTTMLAIPGITMGAFLGGDLGRDLQMLLRVLYAPLTVILFIILIRKYRIKTDDIIRYIEYSAYVLGISLLLSQQLGIERETYGDYAFGDTGIFYAQNDLTLAFGLSLLAAIYRIIYTFSWMRLILIGISFFACLQIGTRASLAVVLSSGLVVLVLAFWAKPAERREFLLQRFMKWIIVLVIAGTVAGLFAYGVNLQSRSDYQKEKLDNFVEGSHPRNILIDSADSYLASREGVLNITGEGMTLFMRGVANYFPADIDEKAVEVDWIDLYGSYGPFFTLSIHALFVIVLIGAVINFLLGSRSAIYGLISASLGLYLGHSLLAGHALTSPISSTLIAGYMGVYITLSKKGGVHYSLRSHSVQ